MRKVRLIGMALVAAVFLATPAGAVERPGDFAGRVVDLDGAQVPGAEVTLRVRHLDGRDVLRAAADREGRFRIGGVKRGKVVLYARAGDGRIGVAHTSQSAESGVGEAVITVTAPQAVRVRAVGPDGEPLAGARVHSLALTGPDGTVGLWPETIDAFGLEWAASGDDGILDVGGLPTTGSVKVELAHPDFVRGDAVEVAVGATDVPGMAFSHGGRFVASIRGDGVEIPRNGLKLDLFGDRSYFVDEPFVPDEGGRCEFTVPFGTWSGLVRGPGVQTLPAAFENVVVTGERTGEIEIVLTARGVVRGRVVAAGIGEPVAERVVSAAVHSPRHETDPYGHGPGWYHSAHAVTDSDGRYEITPGTGRVRLFMRGGMGTEPERIELDVPRDEPAEAPPFRVLMPRLTGVVLDPDGHAVPYAVLKPTGAQRYEISGLADGAGRFDFTVAAIEKSDAGSPIGTLSLRVFDPHRPLETELTVTIDPRTTVAPLTVRLEPRPIRKPTAPGAGDPRFIAVAPGEEAPELAGRETLNADEPFRLADHHGRLVLLDFWTVWCGPCRKLKPEVEAAGRLYGDRLVVVGVHDNSAPIGAIAVDVAKHGPSFPTVVDTADDGTVRRYGIDAFPTYVLIGPDGHVLTTSFHGEGLLADPLMTLRSYLYGSVPEPVEAGRP